MVANAILTRPLVTRVTQRLFSRSARSFGCPPLCLRASPPTSFPICTRKDWLVPTTAATLRVQTPLLSCIKAWCFYFWDNGSIQLQMILQIAPHVLWNEGYTMHKKSHDALNYAIHTKMLMLEDWRWTKASIVTLTTTTFPILETLKPFSFFDVTSMQLITWTIASITSSLCFLIWIGWQREPKLDYVYMQCTDFFVCNCIWSFNNS